MIKNACQVLEPLDVRVPHTRSNKIRYIVLHYTVVMPSQKKFFARTKCIWQTYDISSCLNGYFLIIYLYICRLIPNYYFKLNYKNKNR